MKAIITKYLSATNCKGARIKATDGDGNTITVGYDHALSGELVHRQAAVALCHKMGWQGTLAVGYLPAAYVYVWVGDETGKVAADDFITVK